METIIDTLFNNYLTLKSNVDDLNDKYLINIALSKLDFSPKNHKIIKDNDNIIINCHDYFINVFKDNNDDIINKCLIYEQDLIFDKQPPPYYYDEIINNIDCYKHLRIPNLFICVKYANITINTITKNYKINQCYFNIRKPTTDKYNYFSDIITNIDNPSYYFINNNEKDIYFIPENIIFRNDNKKIIIEPIIPSINKLSDDIDIKPLLSNEIKIKNYNGIIN
jgi:hypothetical protein